ncbi:MAG TPA: hypothetical protein VFG62_19445 [Rhodopila sp.]|nr:hypothetical protein [Rhodopila sp.]
MNGKEDDELQPTWWITRMNELLCRTWRIIRDEAVTDDDRRDARGNVRDDEG